MRSRLVQRFDRLFSYESPRVPALMRLLLGCLMLYDAGTRHPYVIELYSSGGDVFRSFINFTGSMPALPPRWAIALHSGYLAVLVAVAIGFCTRLSLSLALILTIYFNSLDVVSTLTKYSIISIHLLFWLAFTRCDQRLSVDSMRRHCRRVVELSPRWPRLMLRGLVCAIYLGAAITKMRLPDFATGDLLEFSLLDDAWGGGAIGAWLSERRQLLVVLGYAVILFEVAFPLLIWVPPMRRCLLVIACSFHVGLWITLSLQIFSPMMLIALLAFVTEKDMAWLVRFIHTDHVESQAAINGNGMTPMQSSNSPFRFFARLLMYGGYVCVAAAAGVWHGVAVDRYSEFGSASGKKTSVVGEPVPEVEVDEILAAYSPPYRAYFHRVATGTRSGYRQVFGDAARVHADGTVFVLARLLLPHPAMELEWQLIPPDDGEPAVIPGRVTAGETYISIGFRMQDDFKIGRYEIRLLARETGRAWEPVWSTEFELVD